MDTGTIKIKLGRKEYEALLTLYKHHILSLSNMDAHSHLLAEHLLTFYERWKMKWHTSPYADKFTIKLSRPEALAFHQYWGHKITGDPYTEIIIRKAISTIDHAFKSPATMLLS